MFPVFRKVDLPVRCTRGVSCSNQDDWIDLNQFLTLNLRYQLVNYSDGLNTSWKSVTHEWTEPWKYFLNNGRETLSIEWTVNQRRWYFLWTGILTTESNKLKFLNSAESIESNTIGRDYHEIMVCFTIVKFFHFTDVMQHGRINWSGWQKWKKRIQALHQWIYGQQRRGCRWRGWQWQRR